MAYTYSIIPCFTAPIFITFSLEVSMPPSVFCPSIGSSTSSITCGSSIAACSLIFTLGGIREITVPSVALISVFFFGSKS